MIMYMVYLLMTILFISFGVAIKYLKWYFLISGYNLETKENKQEMVKRGIGNFLGNWMFLLGGIMLVGMLLVWLAIPYTHEITWGVFIISVFTMIFISVRRFSTKQMGKLNKYTAIFSIIFSVVIICIVLYMSFSTNELLVEDEKLIITGMYSVEWALEDITEVYLDDELPTIQRRTNGAAVGERRKGNFQLEDMGRGKLFLHLNHPPYLFIFRDDEYVIINSKDAEETLNWFQQLEIQSANNY